MFYHLDGLLQIVRVEVGCQVFVCFVGSQSNLIMFAQLLEYFWEWRVVEVEMF